MLPYMPYMYMCIHATWKLTPESESAWSTWGAREGLSGFGHSLIQNEILKIESWLDKFPVTVSQRTKGTLGECSSSSCCMSWMTPVAIFSIYGTTTNRFSMIDYPCHYFDSSINWQNSKKFEFLAGKNGHFTFGGLFHPHMLPLTWKGHRIWTQRHRIV